MSKSLQTCVICAEKTNILLNLSVTEENPVPCCALKVCYDCSKKLWTGSCPNCRKMVKCAFWNASVKIKKQTDFLRWNAPRTAKKRRVSSI